MGETRVEPSALCDTLMQSLHASGNQRAGRNGAGFSEHVPVKIVALAAGRMKRQHGKGAVRRETAADHQNIDLHDTASGGRVVSRTTSEGGSVQ